MKFMLLLTAIIIIVGIYNILGLTASQIAEDFTTLATRKKSIAHRALIAQGKMKQSKIEKAFVNIKFALQITKKEAMFSKICFASFMLFITGYLFALLIEMYLLMPVLAIGFAGIPYIYVRSTVSEFNKHVRNELETALSVITSAYSRTDNIVMAVKENLPNIKSPVNDIFREFVGQSMINTNLKMAIETLRGKIDNVIFREWCDILISCQDDHTLKETLYPVAEKLTDVRIVNAELEVMVLKPRNEFIVVLILTFILIPSLFFLQREWFDILMFTTVGKVCLTVYVISAVLALLRVLKVTQPIEYQ